MQAAMVFLLKSYYILRKSGRILANVMPTKFSFYIQYLQNLGFSAAKDVLQLVDFFISLC